MTVFFQHHNRRPGRILVSVVLIAVGATATAGRVAAQDASAATGAVATAAGSLEASSTEELIREFDATIDQWRDVIGAMFEQVFLWHGDAQQGTDAEEKWAWAQRESKGRELQHRAFEIAAELVRRDPEAHLQATGLLVGSLGYRDAIGWREGTGEGAEAVLSGGSDFLGSLEQAGLGEADLHLMAGRGFYATGQFEKAKQHLEAAVGAGKGEETDLAKLQMIDKLAAREEREESREEKSADLPRVSLKTSRGEVVVELYEDDAPNTVANFIALVEEGFYDQLFFYHVVKDVMAMTGDPLGDGTGTPSFYIPDEARGASGRAIRRGSLVMAKLPDPNAPPEAPRTIADSASTQFFIALSPIAADERDLTVFGRVVEGIANVSALTKIDVTEEKEARSTVPDQILEAEVLEKRDHPYEPRRL